MLRFLLYLIGGLAALATTLGFVPVEHWVFEFCTHFRPYYALLLAFCLLGLCLKKRWGGLLFLAPLAANLIGVLPLYFADTASYNDENIISVTHANIDMNLTDHSTAYAYLRSRDEDILFLQEVSPVVVDELAVELPNYQIVHDHPLWNTHGSAMLLANDTGLRIVSHQIIHLPEDSDRPLLEIVLEDVALLSLHVIRPKTAPHTLQTQTREYAAIAQWSIDQQAAGREVLIIGDFNTTPWSWRFEQLLTDGALYNSQRGFGLQPTWPAALPLPILPIDHAVQSAGVSVHTREIGAQIGSDHLPLHLSFSVSPPQ